MDFHKILEPLSCDDVGVDVSLHDGFLAIKNEVNNDFTIKHDLIVSLCYKVLTTLSKDLRVAVYLLRSSIYVLNEQEFLQMIEVFISFCLSFGSECFPKKDKAKFNVLKWLSSVNVSNVDKRLSVPNELLSKLESCVKSVFLVDSFSLDNWKKNISIEKAADSDSGKTSKIYESASDDPAQDVKLLNESEHDLSYEQSLTRDSAEDGFDICSISDAKDNCKKSLNFYKNDNKFVHYVSLARAIRWSNFSIEPSLDGCTDFERIKKSDWDLLLKYKSFDCKKAFWFGEELYLKSGGHMSFDLQMEFYELSLNLQDENLSNLIISSVLSFLYRYPQFINFKYRCGTPFASEIAKKWIESMKGSILSDSLTSCPEGDTNDDLGVGVLSGYVEQRKYLTAIKYLKLLKINILKKKMESVFV